MSPHDPIIEHEQRVLDRVHFVARRVLHSSMLRHSKMGVDAHLQHEIEAVVLSIQAELLRDQILNEVVTVPVTGAFPWHVSVAAPVTRRWWHRFLPKSKRPRPTWHDLGGLAYVKAEMTIEKTDAMHFPAPEIRYPDSIGPAVRVMSVRAVGEPEYDRHMSMRRTDRLGPGLLWAGYPRQTEDPELGELDLG